MNIYAVELPDYPGNFKFGAGSSLGEVFSSFLNYAIVLAGMALFAFLILGGFDLLTSGGSQEGIQKGTNKIVYALVGFIIILGTYFILQIVELLFGIKVTG